METINNMANAAAKVVWGEQKEEPVSGVQGDTSKGEPYDAGNIDANGKEETTTSVNGSGSGSADPAQTKPSSHVPGDSTKGQNDVRDPEDPTTDPKTSDVRKNVDDSGEGTDNAENPAKVDGPGPKPIDEVAREHGGDAGRSNENVDKKEDGDSEAPAGNDDDDEGDGPQKTSHGEGTGEQYVKSTGLNADGGDFDATKPGAGREADRLLEEKGIHNPAEFGSKPDPEEDNTGSPETKEKKSLKEKIKEKLHKN